MKQKKRTRIYALMKNTKVFIGRCSAIKLSAVIYRHCRGKHIQTQRHFNLEQKRPDLYVLEEIEDESYVTYRHWLAWIHTFEVSGYEVLNREEALEDSRDLHPATRQIYEQIQKIPLELHLEHGYCNKYNVRDYDCEHTKPDHVATPLENLYAATEKLSVRLSKGEKELINSFAKCLNLSVRDAVVYAINNLMRCDDATMATEQQMYILRERYLQEVEDLKKKITSLSEQLKNQRQLYSEMLNINRMKMSVIQSGIDMYLSYLKPNSTIPLQFEESYYREYMRNTELNYEFPKSEGFAVIRPHAILWGSSSQLRFLVGETDQGKTIKLRYYPSDHFIGMFPANEEFGLRGSCWLVGWEQKEENVMQLNFAMPLSLQQEYDNPMLAGTSLDKLMW